MNLSLKGIHYRNSFVYSGLTFLKLWQDYNLRFEIATKYIEQNSSVLDVCGGDGRLKAFFPTGCQYTCLEASDSFLHQLSQREEGCVQQNLNSGLELKEQRYDVIVMIISLCHFRGHIAKKLLEDFKLHAKRVVIVEDVIQDAKDDATLKRRIMNYLCCTNYAKNLKLFTSQEFIDLMDQHGYSVHQYNKRYSVGFFEKG